MLITNTAAKPAIDMSRRPGWALPSGIDGARRPGTLDGNIGISALTRHHLLAVPIALDGGGSAPPTTRLANNIGAAAMLVNRSSGVRLRASAGNAKEPQSCTNQNIWYNTHNYSPQSTCPSSVKRLPAVTLQDDGAASGH